MEPLAAGAALALGRPVRVVFTRTDDFQATNPASAQVIPSQARRTEGRHADRDHRADDRRPRLERELGCRGHHVAPRRRAVSLGGSRPPRVRRADEPLHVRRVPRSGCPDRRLRARDAAGRARASARVSIRSSCGSEMPWSRPTSASAGTLPTDGRGRGARAHPRAPALADARFAPGRTRAWGSRRATGRAAPSLPQRSAA